MEHEPSDPSPKEVEMAVALATLNAHAEVKGDSGSYCVVCGPETPFPCEYVVQARETLEANGYAEE